MNVVEKITEGLSNDDKELLEAMVNTHDIHNLRLNRISNEDITEIRDDKVRDLNSKIFGGLSVENNTLVSYFNIEPPARGYFYGKNGGIEQNESFRPIRVELIPKVNEVKFIGKEITERISWLAKNIEKNLTNLSEKSTPICGISELLDKDFSGERYSYQETSKEKVDKVNDTLSVAFDKVTQLDNFYSPTFSDYDVADATYTELRKGYMDKISLYLEREEERGPIFVTLEDNNQNKCKFFTFGHLSDIRERTERDLEKYMGKDCKNIHFVDIKKGIELFHDVSNAMELNNDIALTYKGKAFDKNDISEIIHEEKEMEMKDMLKNRLRPARSVERIDDVLKGKKKVNMLNYKLIEYDNNGVTDGR